MFDEMKNENVTGQSNGKREDEVLGGIIAIHSDLITTGVVPSEGWWSRGESNP